ncbi:MAG TPA: hypothetical protein VMJ75_25375 [Candidatus Acidoferrales bacterium]|nr:hypothetical protein [Candidatus Acidoferrales bacterium]
MGKSALVLLFACASAYSDTVTTTGHLRVNGSLTGLSDGIITLEARFDSGPKTLTIPLNKVDTIEFNSVGFNPGAPPKAFGIGPGVGPAPRPSSAPAAEKDIVVLRGNNRKTCKLVGIDDTAVHCEGEKNDYSRKIVLRVLVGAGR